MSKRILSIFLVLCMVFTMVPGTIMAQEEYTTIDTGEESTFLEKHMKEQEETIQDTNFPDRDVAANDTVSATTGSALEMAISPMLFETYDIPEITVCGIQITSENAHDVLGDMDIGNTVSYDPIENILTLNNANLTYDGGNTIEIYMEDLIVEFHGINNIISTSPYDDNAFNTISGGNITFRGIGPGATLLAAGTYGGIYAFDDITIESGLITAIGTKASISTNSGTMTITGGTLIADNLSGDGYCIGQDHGGTLELTVSGEAIVLANNGANAQAFGPMGIQFISTTHNVWRSNGDSSNELVSNPDTFPWANEAVKIIPRSGNTISGAITSGGSAIAEATIQIQKNGAYFGAPTLTAANGIYTIQNIPDGNYTIKVSKFGYFDAYTEEFTVSGGIVFVKDISLDEVPELTGTVTINGTLKYGQTLTAVYESDINAGFLSYLWKRDGVAIGVNSNTYTIVQEDIGHILTCEVTSDVQPGSVTGSTADYITKADGPAITGVSPIGCTTADNNNGKLIGVYSAMEYKKMGSASYIAVTGSELTGLGNGIYLVRFAETPTHNPGPYSTFTITAYNPPSSAPSYSVPEKNESSVEKIKELDHGTSAVNVNNSIENLKTSVLTLEEQEMVAKGENAKIILKVTDISTSISDDEKKLLKDKLAEANGDSEIPILYMDLSLYKQIGNQEQTKVSETKDKISVSIEVPEEFWNTDVTKSRVFYILRIHNGEAVRIDGTYDEEKHLFTFETDRFSTYGLAYEDTIIIQTYQDFRHLQLTAKAGKTSQTLSYKKAENVDGYLIYGGKCGENMKKLADLPSDTTSYTVKGLKQGTYYKYQVKAYRMIEGEKVIIMTSKMIHSVTDGKNYANPTKVTTNHAAVKLMIGNSKTLMSQVVLPKGKKQKEHTAVIRYETSNKNIATVNNRGKITAKEKGTCYIYVYAQNGVNKKIKVTVE